MRIWRLGRFPFAGTSVLVWSFVLIVCGHEGTGNAMDAFSAAESATPQPVEPAWGWIAGQSSDTAGKGGAEPDFVRGRPDTGAGGAGGAGGHCEPMVCTHVVKEGEIKIVTETTCECPLLCDSSTPGCFSPVSSNSCENDTDCFFRFTCRNNRCICTSNLACQSEACAESGTSNSACRRAVCSADGTCLGPIEAEPDAQVSCAHRSPVRGASWYALAVLAVIVTCHRLRRREVSAKTHIPP